MVNKGRSAAAVIAFLCFSCMSIERLGAQVREEPAPVMRVDHETKVRWGRRSQGAPEFTWQRTFQRDFASSLSLLDRLDYVPVERNQARCGNCWKRLSRDRRIASR